MIKLSLPEHCLRTPHFYFIFFVNKAFVKHVRLTFKGLSPLLKFSVLHRAITTINYLLLPLWCYIHYNMLCALVWLNLLSRLVETYLFCEYWLSVTSHSLPPLILPLYLLLCLCDLSMWIGHWRIVLHCLIHCPLTVVLNIELDNWNNSCNVPANHTYRIFMSLCVYLFTAWVIERLLMFAAFFVLIP